MGVWAQDENPITTVATFKSADVITGSGYSDAYGGDEWYISCGGNNKSLGFNKKNCKTISDALGTDAVTTNYGIVVKSKQQLNGVNRITFLYTGGSGDGGKIYLASSKDNVNWTAITLKSGDGLSSQGTTVSQNTELTFEFDNNGDVYYGIILDSGGSKTAAYRFDNVVITFYSVSTGPSITASDVTYAADITSGEIPYIINNPVEGTNLTASTTAEWIQNVSVDAAGSKVTFDMSENTETTPRTGTITLAYGDILTKDVTVTQNGAVAKRTVTIETPENGTLKIFRGEEEVVSGSLIPQGTELRAEVTPDEGYKFRNWQAVDATTHTYTTNFTYTVGESDVTFSAKFDKIVYHTITWSVNGVETTSNVEEGTDITFVAPTENIPEGYVFKGWYGSTLEPQDNAPEYVTSATATADVTYYAVFAKQKGTGSGEQKIELTNERIKKAREDASDTNGYKDNQDIDGWTGKFFYYKNGNNYALQINRNETTSNKAYNSHLTTPVVSSPIQSITIKTNCNTASGRTVYLCSSNDIGAANEANAVYGSGKTDNVNGSITIPVTGNPTQLNIYPYGGVIYIESVTLTYGESATFYDFRTSVTAPTTATITLAEACTDGKGMYYGTYSNSKAFVVPDDIIVSEISVIDNKLLVDSYSTGAVVPANTGVMVSSMTAGDHEVTLSEKAGTSVLGEGNMLRPTGDNGITASEMAEKDADCKFYRLTMHKGTTLGYFWGAAEGAAFNVAGNKAYLAVPAAQAAKVAGFAIDGGGTTAIESIENGNGSEVSRKVYNLQGQRMSGALPKGLYIIGGRKVIVK